MVSVSGVADIVDIKQGRSERPSTDQQKFTSAGAMLQAVREDAKLSLEQVSQGTNVKVTHLQSIEEMAVDRLPARPYTIGFVKSYAEFLDLPVEELVAKFKTQAGYENNPVASPVDIKRGQDIGASRELSLLAVVGAVFFILWCAFQITRPATDNGPLAEIEGYPITNPSGAAPTVVYAPPATDVASVKSEDVIVETPTPTLAETQEPTLVEAPTAVAEIEPSVPEQQSAAVQIDASEPEVKVTVAVTDTASLEQSGVVEQEVPGLTPIETEEEPPVDLETALETKRSQAEQLALTQSIEKKQAAERAAEQAAERARLAAAPEQTPTDVTTPTPVTAEQLNREAAVVAIEETPEVTETAAVETDELELDTGEIALDQRPPVEAAIEPLSEPVSPPVAEAVEEPVAAPIDEPRDVVQTPVSDPTGAEDLNRLVLESVKSSGNARNETPTLTPATVPAAQPVPAGADGVTVSAKVLTMVQPVYPSRCNSQAPEDTVMVVFDVSAGGRVNNPRVTTSSNDCFHAAAIQAIMRWQFTPAMDNGTATSSLGQATRFRFKLPE